MHENNIGHLVKAAEIDLQKIFAMAKASIAKLRDESIDQWDDLYPNEYVHINWMDCGGKHLVVHRLIVHPLYQGLGISKILMRFCEELATRLGYESIKLDAFVNNAKAVNLYKSLGYEIMGTVRFRKGEFVCMKKKIQVVG